MRQTVQNRRVWKKIGRASPLMHRARVNLETEVTTSSASVTLIEKSVGNMDANTPPELESAIRFRYAMLLALDGDHERQALEKQKCQNDIVYFVENYGWTFDPRLPDPNIPFKLFDKQKECLKWIESIVEGGNDGVFEKSRDMGATWLCVVFLVHRWLFQKGFRGAVGTRSKDLLDRLGDPDSIFEKIRYFIAFLPGWMLPMGFVPSRHLLIRRIVNPENGSSITGEVGKNMGRGGRSTVYFVDEAAFIPKPETVDRALSQNARTRIYMSTPNGQGNPFYKKRISGNIPVFTLHWKDDPRKNHWEARMPDGRPIAFGQGQPTTVFPEGVRVYYPWYEREKLRINDPVTIAQELDIDYEGSLEDAIMKPEWVEAAVNARLKINFDAYTLTTRPVAGFDVADGGSNSNCVTTRYGPVVMSKQPGETGIFVFDEGDSHRAAIHATQIISSEKCIRAHYDSVGPGVSVRDYWSYTKKVPFEVAGVDGADRPTTDKWSDDETSRDKFKNLRAELWGRLAQRFRKTYEYLEHGVAHPLDELISIPDNPRLRLELKAVRWKRNAGDDGKLLVESKAAMRDRGVASPDLADSLAYAFAPKPRKPSPDENMEAGYVSAV